MHDLPRFGLTRETTELDNHGSTLTLIRKVRNHQVMKTYKQYKERFKVKNQKEQMVEYMKHADKIMEKHKAGILVVSDADPTLYPGFWSEYPKFDVDGSYFVVSTWCEIVND